MVHPFTRRRGGLRAVLVAGCLLLAHAVAAQQPPQRSWTAPQTLTPPTQQSPRPQIAIDGGGNALVTWDARAGRVAARPGRRGGLRRVSVPERQPLHARLRDGCAQRNERRRAQRGWAGRRGVGPRHRDRARRPDGAGGNLHWNQLAQRGESPPDSFGWRAQSARGRGRRWQRDRRVGAARERRRGSACVAIHDRRNMEHAAHYLRGKRKRGRRCRARARR